MENDEATVLGIVCEQLCRDASEIDMDTDLGESVGMDSLDQVELTMLAEEKFSVTIPDCETGFRTPRQLLDAVNRARANAAG